MPASAPKTKAPATTATLPKSKSPKSDSSGTSTPMTFELQDATPAASTWSSGRPDKAAYDAEQEKLKKNIDALNAKMVCDAYIKLRSHCNKLISS